MSKSGAPPPAPQPQVSNSTVSQSTSTLTDAMLSPASFEAETTSAYSSVGAGGVQVKVPPVVSVAPSGPDTSCHFAGVPSAVVSCCVSSVPQMALSGASASVGG